MKDAFNKLSDAQKIATENENITYTGGNEANLVEIPLDKLYVSYASNILAKRAPMKSKVFLAYIIKADDQCSFALHFPVDFGKVIHSVTETHLLTNPESSLIMLLPGNENIPDELKKPEDFSDEQSMENFHELIKVDNGGIPLNITKDLSSGQSHSKNFRFDLETINTNVILGLQQLIAP
jgi:hypothetical protein